MPPLDPELNGVFDQFLPLSTNAWGSHKFDSPSQTHQEISTKNSFEKKKNLHHFLFGFSAQARGLHA